MSRLQPLAGVILLLVAPSLFLTACGPGSAGSSSDDHAAEDHDHPHGAGQAPGDVEIEPAVVTLFGERVLMFMEHPRLVRDEPARFLAHFSVLATGEPVRAGSVELTIGGTSLRVGAPLRDGLFTPEGPFAIAGRFPARITVTSDQASETLDLGELDVHPDAASARAEADAEAEVDPADAVPFLMEQQWRIDLLLAEARPRRLTERLVVPAEVVAAEGASAVVSAPASGRLLPSRSGTFPRTGDHVEAGQELALVSPPLAAADAAQLRALDLQWQLETLTVERRLAESAARVAFAEREVARLAALRPDGLATQQQLELAERDLALARGEVDAARASREALDGLQERREGEAWSRDGTLRIPLTAPISGELEVAGVVPGESLEAGDAVFVVIDRSRLGVEGRLSEFDLPLLAAAGGAVVSFPALPSVLLPASAYDDVRVFHVSQNVDSASRTLRLRALLDASDADLRPGLLAELRIAVAETDAVVAIPQSAVVTDQGMPTAYVMIEGETFQRRNLVLGLADGGFVEVLDGVLPGEHVATRGAAAIRMAALSPSEFGHGHAH